MRRLILLASPGLRRGPLSALQRFVRDHEDFLNEFRIVTTEGCRRAILRSGLLQSHQHFEAELPGYLGGIVHLTSLVVSDADRPEAVIYLIDPKDPSAIFPETNAIKRECVVHEVTFLSTSRAAREWATISWKSQAPQFLSPEDQGGLDLVRSLGEETIALIAHDGRKKELLEFARDHFDFLLRFRRRVATGTTGTLLNGCKPESKRLKPAEWKDLEPVCSDLAGLIASSKNAGRLQANAQFVDQQLGGPYGGDVMIARMVLAGSCQRIVFFENPLQPHEHTEDIQLLERTGRLRGKSTICIHDRETAAWFVRKWESIANEPQPQPLLLSSVLDRLFGAKCVLVTSQGHWSDTWERLREAAGWFLLSHLATLANELKKVSASVRVAVSSGVGCSQVVMEVASRLKRLKELEDKKPARPKLYREDLDEASMDTVSGADYPFQTPSLADDRYFRPKNVIVAPLQGLLGSEDEDVEANEIAHRLAEVFDGDHLLLAASLLVRREGDVERRRRRLRDVSAHWSTTDVVLACTSPLLDDSTGRPRTPRFAGFTDEMKRLGACGDVGGLFLNPQGSEVHAEHFERVGMSSAQVKRVRRRRGMVVVGGAQAQRAEITLAALLGGWVSVLVTDTDFARDLVLGVARLVSEGQLKLLPPDKDGPLVETARFQGE